MKKTFLVIIFSLACVFSLLAFSGCDEINKHVPIIDHAVHPTCVSSGLTQGIHCDICGEVLEKQRHVAPLGHEYCEEDNTCIRCGDVAITPSTYFNFKELEDGTYEISVKDRSNLPKCIVIPSNYGSNYITSIADGCFNNCDQILRVVLPASINNIGYCAFSASESLNSIIIAEDNEHYTSFNGNLYTKDKGTLLQYAIGKDEKSFVVPNYVSTIFDCAFFESKLENVTIGSNVVTIGFSAFHNSDNLKDIEIPNSVITIGHSAFQSCDSLFSASLGKSVYEIGSAAFYDCDSLKRINIPASVHKIGLNALHSCNNLSVISVDQYNAFFSSIDGHLYSKDGRSLIQCATAYDDTLFIPNQVNCIYSGAFTTCSRDLVIYYEGSVAEWNKLMIGLWNELLDDVDIYTYSETKPEVAGNYWYYDASNNIAIWNFD